MKTPDHQDDRLRAYARAAETKDPADIDAYAAIILTQCLEGVLNERGYVSRLENLAKLRKISHAHS